MYGMRPSVVVIHFVRHGIVSALLEAVGNIYVLCNTVNSAYIILLAYITKKRDCAGGHSKICPGNNSVLGRFRCNIKVQTICVHG